MRETTDGRTRTRNGLILRAFAAEEKQVPERVEQVLELAGKASLIELNGASAYDRIDILVWKDPAFMKTQECDCGETAPELRREISVRRLSKRIHISEADGDLFCGILNFGVGLQLYNGIRYSHIISAEARDYLRSDVLAEFQEAFMAGAKVVGLAINELQESILEGQVANTFAAWDNLALMGVGMFDMRAAKLPKGDPSIVFKQGWSEVAGDVIYPLAGVEEIIPLIMLVKKYGACVAPIMTRDKDGKEVRYHVPDPVKNPDLWKRHWSKMGTKMERKTGMANSLIPRVELSFLKKGVMPQYRRWAKDASEIK